MDQHHYVPEFDKDGECVDFVTALDCTAMEEEWWEQLYEEERQRDDDDGSGEKIHFWNDRRELDRRFSMSREDLLAEGFRLIAEEYLNDSEEELWPRAQRALKRHARFMQRATGKKIVRASKRRRRADWFNRGSQYSFSKRVRFCWWGYESRQGLRQVQKREMLKYAEAACSEQEDEPVVVKHNQELSAKLFAYLDGAERDPEWNIVSSWRWFYSRSGNHPPAPDHANWREGHAGCIRWARAFDPHDLKR